MVMIKSFFCRIELLAHVVKVMSCDGALSKEKVSVVKGVKESVTSDLLLSTRDVWTACLRNLTRTGLLQRVLITLDLNESIQKTGAHCAMASSCVVTAARMCV